MGQDELIYTAGRVDKPLIWVPSHGIIPLSILLEAHQTAHHHGLPWSVAYTRQRYWLMSPSRIYPAIRKNCRQCMMTRKAMYGEPAESILPESRRSVTKPFDICGMDFCGPVFDTIFEPPFDDPPYASGTEPKKGIRKVNKKVSRIEDSALMAKTLAYVTTRSKKKAEEAAAVGLPDPATTEGEPPAKKAKRVRKEANERAQKTRDKLSKIGLGDIDPTKHRIQKRYFILLITCANTRAVALYLCKEERSSSVAAAWNDFCAEHGTPAIVYSDNGPSFTKFEDNLRQYAHTQLQKISPSTEWRFNPPGALWWGGFYERMVGTVKKTLHKTCGKMRVNSELTANYIVRSAQHCLNHRPLWGLAQDHKAEIITPQSFLRVEVPTAEITSNDPAGENGLAMLKRLYASQARRITHIWRMFQRGYMSELRKHTNIRKQSFDCQTLKVGDLVLYEVPETIRNFWPIARVRKLIPGRDGIVRAVYLQKYVPNEINQDLWLKKYDRRAITPAMKRELMGYFKNLPNRYSIRKLAPYEFWFHLEPPTDVEGEDKDRLPHRILSKQGKKHKPVRFTYYAQEDCCATSLLPQSCMGGMVCFHLRSNKLGQSNKIVEIKADHSDDIYPFNQAPLTQGQAEYKALHAYCYKSSYQIGKVSYSMPKK